MVIGISGQENGLRITPLPDYKCRLDGHTIMTCILTTKNERVFLCDKDSNLHELIFNSCSGLLMRRKACLSLICHTRGFKNMFSMKQQCNSDIILMVEDTERHLIHLLHRDGVIDIYSLGRGSSHGTAIPEKYARVLSLILNIILYIFLCL